MNLGALLLGALLALASCAPVYSGMSISPTASSVYVVGLNDTVGVGTVHTNQPNAEQCFNGYCPRSTRILDLSLVSQARLIFRVSVASASPNNPRLYMNYSTDDVTYAGLAAGANPTGSLATLGWRDTGWFDIAAGARIGSAYVQLMINGGDGVADPNIEVPTILFR